MALCIFYLFNEVLTVFFILFPISVSMFMTVTLNSLSAAVIISVSFNLFPGVCLLSFERYPLSAFLPIRFFWGEG